MGAANYPPHTFPHAFEVKYGVSRNDYDMLISALELYVRRAQYTYDQYVNSVLAQGFEVRIAVIKTRQDGNPESPSLIQGVIAFSNSRSIPVLQIDATGDPNAVSSYIRSRFYPS